jgi:hypothetical protein
LKVNCGEEGTEWHSLGKVPLDFIENQEDEEAQEHDNLNRRCSREEITDQQPRTVTRRIKQVFNQRR